jgi:hypothetical protein
VIALLSPDEIFETGLRTGASEKRVTKLGFGVNVDMFLQSGVRAKFVKLGRFLAMNPRAR